MILVARTASCHVTNAFSPSVKLIWPRSSFKTTKCQKNPILAKNSRHRWVNTVVKKTDSKTPILQGVTYDTGGADVKAGGVMAGMSR